MNTQGQSTGLALWLDAKEATWWWWLGLKMTLKTSVVFADFANRCCCD